MNEKEDAGVDEKFGGRSRRSSARVGAMALVSGLVFGAVITAVVTAHDGGASDQPTAQPPGSAASPPQIRPGVTDVSPVGGPGGQLLLDEAGRVLVFDDSRMSAEVTAQLDIAPVDEAAGEVPVMVIHEHLPELFAAGVVYAVEAGSPAIIDQCDTPQQACDLRNAASVRAAERAGNAKRVDPTTYRGSETP